MITIQLTRKISLEEFGFMILWLEHTIYHYKYVQEGMEFFTFEDYEDAIAFKLKFGGNV